MSVLHKQNREEKKTLKKIQNVRVAKSKMLVLPNPKCQFYQIQNVSFTKSIMSVLPIQNVSFTKSKMSVLHKQKRTSKTEPNNRMSKLNLKTEPQKMQKK